MNTSKESHPRRSTPAAAATVGDTQAEASDPGRSALDTGTHKHTPGTSPGLPTMDDAGFVAAAEAALADLERRYQDTITPVDAAVLARVRDALGRLSACHLELHTDALVVPGSMGQRRPHPLLKVEADLRREIATVLRDIGFRIEQGARLDRLNRITRERTTGGPK